MNPWLRYCAAFFMAFALVAVVSCAAPSKQQSAGEYIDDAVITTKVKAAILNNPDLRVNEISVETYDGVVQLSGFVSSRAEINRAMEVARGVGGVKDVKNDMRVK
ncbi:BON domain-containing protein [Ectothiorhodospira shaposhnikovii]|uniref:BON domain-containing protein n=1 Tax=Ectothiorhodospira shaposhnikovii TaxID=1054 RepID=UPI001908CDCF|nr:BON domain-containing protein [Ectothiorhodospira shaposhnikovii]MBK1672452.1 transporter [Ectothiorhodospira shaposhnikovii]